MFHTQTRRLQRFCEITSLVFHERQWWQLTIVNDDDDDTRTDGSVQRVADGGMSDYFPSLGNDEVVPLRAAA